MLAPRRSAEVPALAAPAATAAAGPNGCDDGGAVSDESNDHYVVSALAGIYNDTIATKPDRTHHQW